MSVTITSIRQALDDAPMRSLHWKIFVFAAMGIFIDGYDFFIIAAALPLIGAAWHPAPAVLGLIAAAATVGAVFGGAFIGRYADVWGRRMLAMLTMSMFAVFSIVSAAAWDWTSLAALRFILGMWIGADYPTGSAYVAEFMPARERSRLLFASLSFQALGAVAGAGFGLALLQAHWIDAWRAMLAAGCVPALVILVLRRSLPESPRWLYAQGRIDDAKHVLQQVYGVPVTFALEPEPRTPALPFAALFSARFLPRTLLATIPWFCMDIALYGMSLFTPVVLAATAFGSGTGTFWTRDIKATEGAIFLDLFLIAGFLLGIIAIPRFGAFRMQTIGFAGSAIGLAVVAAASTVDNTFLIFLGFGIFNALVNAGPNGTTYVLPALVFPTEVRASGSGLAAAAGKVGASAGIFLMPVLRASYGLPIAIAVVVCCALTGLLVTVVLRKHIGDHEAESIRLATA